MRIAFVIDEFPSITQTFVLNQITGLIDRSHRVRIYPTVKNTSIEIPLEVEKYQLLSKTFFRPQIGKTLSGLSRFLLKDFTRAFKTNPRMVIRSFNVFKYDRYAFTGPLFNDAAPFLDKVRQFDIVHAHFGLNGLRAMRLRDLGAINGKIVTTFHGYDISKDIFMYGARRYKRLFEKGDFFLTVSRHFKKELIRLGCPEPKIAVHRCGVKVEPFSAKTLNTGKDSSPRGPGKKIRIVSIGRFVEKKGLQYAVQAVSKLRDKNYGLSYSIIGDGELRTEIETLIRHEGVNDIVQLHRWLPHDRIMSILSESDILLAPSVTSSQGDKEGIPVVIIEAMAVGIPVISTHHSGIPELVENGVNGFLVLERDIGALTEKLALLIHHTDMRNRMGRAARRRVEMDFNIDHLNDRLIEVYRRISDGCI